MPRAIRCGVSLETFWDSTLLEIWDIESAVNDQRYMERKCQIGDMFTLADAISTRIIYFFSNKEDRSEEIILQPWDVYPREFAEEKETAMRIKEEREIERIVEDRKERNRLLRERRTE